jgi:hypothetical protein
MKRSVLARFVRLVQLIKTNPFSTLSFLASQLEVFLDREGNPAEIKRQILGYEK